MAIRKEVFFECLEEAVNLGERMDDWLSAAQYLLSKGGNVGEFRDLVVMMTEKGPANIGKCRLRHEIMRLRWKKLENDRIRQEDIKLGKRMKLNVEIEDRIEGEAVYFEVDADIMAHLNEYEVLRGLPEHEKMRKAKMLQDMNMLREERKETLDRMVSKIMRNSEKGE